MGVLVGVVSLQSVSLWEWPAFSGYPCGSGQPSVDVLWEWPAFSGCPCGSGQPSVGVPVGVASLQWIFLVGVASRQCVGGQA